MNDTRHELIDSHCHFDAPAFDADRDALYQRARQAGVRHIITPAITATSWPGLRQICARYPGVHPAYGLHPMFQAEHRDDDIDRLQTWLERERPVAVGECGLDFYIPKPDKEKQTAIFRAQLALAQRFELPVIIHARKSVEAVMMLLREYPDVRGVMHSYSGSLEQARQLIERGFLLGFGGPLTWPRATRLRRIAATLPLESLLLETDAPDQPGEQHRGQRNEPAWLPEVAHTLAELRKISVDEVIEVTSDNARRLFSLKAA